jgi:hypothetical protein
VGEDEVHGDEVGADEFHSQEDVGRNIQGDEVGDVELVGEFVDVDVDVVPVEVGPAEVGPEQEAALD